VTGTHLILYTDNPAVVRIADAAFDEPDQRLTVCESGMELLAAVRALAADAVVLDLDVHGLSGTLLASAIEELAPELPIVAVTVRPDMDARPILQRGIPCLVLDFHEAAATHEGLRALVAAGRHGLAVGRAA
jgi:CheY-like chemotaxis protein